MTPLSQEIEAAFQEWAALKNRLSRIGKLAANMAKDRQQKIDVNYYEREVYPGRDEFDVTLIRNLTMLRCWEKKGTDVKRGEG